MSIQEEFDKRAPWITRFVIDGKEFGGAYDPVNDRRMPHFRRLFPQPGRVLELGSLEGGHTFQLAQLADEVVAVDCREASLEKVRFVCEAHGLANVTTELKNLECDSLESLGTFDLLFNVGVLYHMPRPVLLLKQLAGLAPMMFLWTHIAANDSEPTDRDGYRGWIYSGERGASDPLSGLSQESFWFAEAELYRALDDHGYLVDVLDRDLRHPNGPCVLLLCRRKSGRS